jgi:hypothetical protein
MPSAPPPLNTRSASTRLALSAGTVLWRVHRRTRPATAFNPNISDGVFGGGRFDSTAEDPFPFLYVAMRPETALLETLVRSIPFDARGVRYIRRAALTELCVSALETTVDLTFISLLSSADLAASCQDEWLISAEPRDYPQTRRWGHWLRGRAPWSQGLVWPSRRDVGQRTAVLFGDRVPPEALGPVAASRTDLDGIDGAKWLNHTLSPFRIQVKPPRDARP